ncbi:MAG TPA: hypothetical protein ENJ31_13750, partial [Anaerolineae bacterium]|nr:hypothetical protein [Anaerolineae bacterium]
MTGRLRALRPLPALALIAAVLAACQPPFAPPPPTPVSTPRLNLPPADETAFAFLQAWQRADYPAMYSLLSYAAQDAYSEQAFTAAYREVVEEATILSVTPRILSAYQP